MDKLEKEYIELTDKLLDLIDERDSINKEIKKIERKQSELKKKGLKNE